MSLEIVEAPVATPPIPRTIHAHRTVADRAFRGLAGVAGRVTLLVLLLIAVFLVNEARPALDAAGWDFLRVWEWTPGNEPPVFGIAAVLYGTVVVATIAIVLAVPVAIATALFVNEFVPHRIGRCLTLAIDLLAAIPSLIYGMWGLSFLVPRLTDIERWLADHLSFIPIFENQTGLYGRSMFDAGVVLALMVVRIVATVSREVMSQAPRVLCEAALALGGTRWGMIRKVVLPFGRSGVTGGAMLGLGRALGETIAITLLLGIVFEPTGRILESNGGSIAAHIVLAFGEASDLQRSGLIAAGLVLFGLTLIVNLVARTIVARHRTVEAR